MIATHPSVARRVGFACGLGVALSVLLVPAAVATETMDPPRFDLPSAEVLSGDPVEIRVRGLEPGARVTLSAERVYGRSSALYRSTALFAADSEGVIDLATAAPIEGAWSGIDPRGLYWSMSATGDPVPEWPRDVVQLSLDIDRDGVADTQAMVRMAKSRDDLVEVSLGDDFPGAFLVRPPGDEPLPAIIALGGSEGGDSAVRSRAPQLASRGYAVVGLPYYSPAWGGAAQFPDLPQAFHDIPIDRLEGVRDWLRARDDVMADRIGLYGVSKGAEFVLEGARRIEGFAAVVAYVPSDVIWEAWGPGTVEGQDSCFSWRGEPLAFVPYEGMSAEIAKFGTGETVRIRTPHDRGRAAHPDRIEPARIRVEEIDEPVFVVGGDADNTWDSGSMARNIASRRKAAGRVTVAIVDEQAGHGLSGDGFSPTGAAEARVQGQAFPAMLEFFARHLKAETGS